MNRSAASGIVFGIFIIAFGLLELLKGIFNWTIGLTSVSFFAFVVIAISLVSMIHRGLRFYNVIFLAIGLWILARDLGIFGGNSFAVLLSLLLVLFGIWLIVNAVVRSVPSGPAHTDTADYIHCGNTFSDYQIKNTSRMFRGGNCSSVFGRLRIDLREIAVDGSAVLEVDAVFGTVEVLMPRGVAYKTQVTPVFGSFLNNAPAVQPTPGAPCLLIKGTAVFGTCTLL